MWIIKCSLLLTLIIIFKQDFTTRLVYFFLYPLMGILTFSLFCTEVIELQVIALSILINLIFVGLLMGACSLYSKYKLELKLNEVLGLGDILFFIFISFSFSTISFIVLFIFSLFFSLLLHALLKNKNENKTVPLAGYMSLFFATIFLVSFFWESKFLYAY